MIRLALALMLAAAPAAAEPFILLIHESPDQIALRTEPGEAGKAYWGAYAAWGAEAAAAGVMKGGAAMVAVPAATYGNLPPGALILGGFFQIEATSVGDAQAWAAKLPAASTGAVEIRAIVPMPGM
jgi:hypothetical protein